MFKFTKNIDCFIDIGSNKGQFLLIARKYYPKAKIYSFEPQKDLINIQKKLFKNIKFFNICLGNKSETRYFNILSRRDSSSLLEPKIFKNSIYKIEKKIKVSIKKFDQIISLNKTNNFFLKIDVQGYELEVLKGAINNLDKVNYILIELSSKKLYKKQPKISTLLVFLKQNNYKLVKIFNKSFNSNFWQADYLFIKI